MTNRKKTSKKRLSAIQKTILTIIISLSILIISLVISAFFLNPEARVKSKISALTSEYYENYLYENLKNSDQVPDFEKVIEGLGKDQLAKLFVVSEVKILEAVEGEELALAKVKVSHHQGHFCSRCWNYEDAAIEQEDGTFLCCRCQEVVK